ncbi:MAG: hypothetical protein DRJ01_07905 [Bacteroidetes bacterium]|nr:MAG: hypothetical protein DRJ01_07905 [Bacteroidota bacterium]
MKKILNIVIVIIVSFFVISSFGSCKKAKEKKIVGNWRLVTEKEPVQGQTVTYFVFSDDNIVKRISGDTLVADYSVLSEDLHYYLQINGFDVSFVDLGGKYSINELSKDILIITRIQKSNGDKGGAFKRLEFVKE